MVNTQYKEIIDYLKEAQLDLENADDSIKDRLRKFVRILMKILMMKNKLLNGSFSRVDWKILKK